MIQVHRFTAATRITWQICCSGRTTAVELQSLEVSLDFGRRHVYSNMTTTTTFASTASCGYVLTKTATSTTSWPTKRLSRRTRSTRSSPTRTKAARRSPSLDKAATVSIGGGAYSFRHAITSCRAPWAVRSSRVVVETHPYASSTRMRALPFPAQHLIQRVIPSKQSLDVVVTDMFRSGTYG